MHPGRGYLIQLKVVIAAAAKALHCIQWQCIMLLELQQQGIQRCSLWHLAQP